MPPKSASVRPKAARRKPQFEKPAGEAPVMASRPFEGGKRLDRASPEEKMEPARPKDTGRSGA